MGYTLYGSNCSAQGTQWPIEQARQFNKATDVTALALTKIDGTAKGGVAIGISGSALGNGLLLRSLRSIGPNGPSSPMKTCQKQAGPQP